MRYDELQVGMRVLICPILAGSHTSGSQGWDSDMGKYIGTEQTIGSLSEENVMFRGRNVRDGVNRFHWDLRDLVPCQEPPIIEMKGEKQTFDENELII